MAKVSFPKIIEAATTRANWKNTSTFANDCNCVLESLVAAMDLDKIEAAVHAQGFRAAHEYRRAASVLREIALERSERRRAVRAAGEIA